MTTEVNLNLIWASTGGAVDPGDVKYQTGWVVEIPTFEHFNFVLQNLSTNQLALAEKGSYNWHVSIAYVAGSTVIEAGLKYTCITSHTGQQPSLDATRSYWVLGSIIGAVAADTLIDEQGVAIKNVNARATATSWDGTDLFISNKSAVIQLNSDNAASKNWLIANVSGELVVVDVGTTEFPDARSIAVTQPLTHRVFHEGHPPTQSEVAGTVPEAPTDSTYYTRRNGAWSPMPQSITGNAATATKLQTTRQIGGVSFDGSANINLPGVNTAGNQNTSGNAATATKLQTARQIGGVSFDGSANINLPGVNIAGNQNTSGNAATASNPSSGGSFVTTLNVTSYVGIAKTTTSGPYNIATKATGSFAHGLGTYPLFIRCFAVCLVVDSGYSVGDRLEIPTGLNEAVGASETCMAVKSNTTTVYFILGNSTQPITAIAWDTGNGTQLDKTKWQLYFVAGA